MNFVGYKDEKLIKDKKQVVVNYFCVGNGVSVVCSFNIKLVFFSSIVFLLLVLTPVFADNGSGAIPPSGPYISSIKEISGSSGNKDFRSVVVNELVINVSENGSITILNSSGNNIDVDKNTEKTNNHKIEDSTVQPNGFDFKLSFESILSKARQFVYEKIWSPFLNQVQKLGFGHDEAKPDLTALDITWFPQSPNNLDKIVFTYPVKNIGSSDINTPFETRFYIKDSYGRWIWMGSCDLTGLRTGDSHDCKAPPDNSYNIILGPGQHFIKSDTDVLKDIPEENEYNNENFKDLNVRNGASFDLVPISATVYPTYPKPSSSIYVRFGVKNNGLDNIQSSFDYALDVCDIETCGRSQNYIQRYECTANSLASGQTASCNTPTFNLSAGTYLLTTNVDHNREIGETNDDNNVLIENFSVRDNWYDLIARPVTHSSNPNNRDPITLTYPVYNNGPEHITTPFESSLYIETDGAWVWTGHVCTISSLNVGSTHYCQFTTSLQSGRHRLRNYVDWGLDFREYDETNNIDESSTIDVANVVSYDLIPTEFTITPNNPTDKNSIKIKYGTKNSGPDDITTSFLTELILEDLNLHTCNVPSLAKFQSYYCEVTIPQWQAGTFVIKNIVDQGNRISETNDTNNYRNELLHISGNTGTINVDVDYENSLVPIPNALVFLNDYYKGDTDANGKLSTQANFGQQTVNVKCPAPNYNICGSQNIDVDGIKNVDINCNCPQQEKGILRIDTVNEEGLPLANVVVYVDNVTLNEGTYQGYTNFLGLLDIANLSYGQHNLVLQVNFSVNENEEPTVHYLTKSFVVNEPFAIQEFILDDLSDFNGILVKEKGMTKIYANGSKTQWLIIPIVISIVFEGITLYFIELDWNAFTKCIDENYDVDYLNGYLGTIDLNLLEKKCDVENAFSENSECKNELSKMSQNVYKECLLQTVFLTSNFAFIRIQQMIFSTGIDIIGGGIKRVPLVEPASDFLWAVGFNIRQFTATSGLDKYVYSVIGLLLRFDDDISSALIKIGKDSRYVKQMADEVFSTTTQAKMFPGKYLSETELKKITATRGGFGRVAGRTSHGFRVDKLKAEGVVRNANEISGTADQLIKREADWRAPQNGDFGIFINPDTVAKETGIGNSINIKRFDGTKWVLWSEIDGGYIIDDAFVALESKAAITEHIDAKYLEPMKTVENVFIPLERIYDNELKIKYVLLHPTDQIPSKITDDAFTFYTENGYASSFHDFGEGLYKKYIDPSNGITHTSCIEEQAQYVFGNKQGVFCQ